MRSGIRTPLTLTLSPAGEGIFSAVQGVCGPTPPTGCRCFSLSLRERAGVRGIQMRVWFGHSACLTNICPERHREEGFAYRSHANLSRVDWGFPAGPAVRRGRCLEGSARRDHAQWDPNSPHPNPLPRGRGNILGGARRLPPDSGNWLPMALPLPRERAGVRGIQSMTTRLRVCARSGQGSNEQGHE
jgi:hypothetical protein